MSAFPLPSASDSNYHARMMETDYLDHDNPNSRGDHSCSETGTPPSKTRSPSTNSTRQSLMENTPPMSPSKVPMSVDPILTKQSTCDESKCCTKNPEMPYTFCAGYNCAGAREGKLSLTQVADAVDDLLRNGRTRA